MEDRLKGDSTQPAGDKRATALRPYRWRVCLFLICLTLLGWLWQDAPPAASLSPTALPISVTGYAGLVEPGDEITYQIRLLNWTDPIIADGIITHTLPPGFSYVPDSAQVTVGGWPITRTNPISQGNSLTWGPFQLPAAGHTAHNPYGVHTFVQDLCVPEFIDFQLDQALELVGSGGYVTQLFYRITTETTGPDPCAVYYVNAAYDRNLVPIIRLQGVWNPVGFWEKPDPGPNGDYAEIAAAFARYVDGLPRRNTHPLYVTIWNEPDLWVEWSGAPNAQEYGRFFVAVSGAIRDLNDPRIRVLNGAVTPANKTFIRQLMAVPGFVNAFDAWASHCYPYNHPPWYNIHWRTARYGNATIDCYIEERDTIAKYGGRTGFKFVVKESGHGLGDNLYAFEGYPAINESNRASYISSAFDSCWQTWPEIIAVTPFELGDPWSGWEWLDWIDYTVSLDPFGFSYTPHPQYNTVAALSKPYGQTVPHGIEITFRARVDPGVPLGSYPSHLQGSAAGATVALTPTAEVQVVSQVHRIYLPLMGAKQNEGVWYASDASASAAEAQVGDQPSTQEDGAIIPTHLLTRTEVTRQAEAPLALSADQTLEGEIPHLLTLSLGEERLYLAQEDELAVLNPNTFEVEKRIPLDHNLRALASGQDNQVYGVLSTGGLILIDMASGEIVARSASVQSAQSLTFDPQTQSLLVADVDSQSILRLSADLSARSESYPLPDLPGQTLLDSTARRLFVTLPGGRRVLALNADTLQPLGEIELQGGPLITTALDEAGNRIYVLSALSPEYRGIWVLNAADLQSLALIAGTPASPLKRATTLALSPSGDLLVAEATHLYRISPDNFELIEIIQLNFPVAQGSLHVSSSTNRALWIDPNGVQSLPVDQAGSQ